MNDDLKFATHLVEQLHLAFVEETKFKVHLTEGLKQRLAVRLSQLLTKERQGN